MVSMAVALTSGLGSERSFINMLTANNPTSGLENLSLQQIKASHADFLILELWLAQNLTQTGNIGSMSMVLAVRISGT